MASDTALMGGLGFFLIALVYHQFPRIIGRSLYSASLATRQFWIQTFGIAVVLLSLDIAAVTQGFLQIGGVQTNTPVSAGDRWFVITDSTRAAFVARIGGGALVALGLFLFVKNIVSTSTQGADAEVEELPFAATPAPEPVGVSA